ncbi:hypothetical protein EDD22DRAFT_954205 [Suillus occidentalis]|nr:hypothetical protein EDD22DRAFT_954205 [Suillus occidentalis]
MKKHMKTLKSHWIGKNNTIASSQINPTASNQINPTASSQINPTASASSQNGKEHQPMLDFQARKDIKDANVIEPLQINQSINVDQHIQESLDINNEFEVDDQLISGDAMTPAIQQDDQDGLLHHPYLDTINIIMDTDLKTLCCLVCQVALPPDHVSSHIRLKHPALKLDSAQYCQAVADTPCKVQQLDRGAHKQFWRVADTKETSCDYQEVIDKMRNEMVEVTRVEQVPRDKWMISPWLLITKWHEHVAGHDVMTLRGLVGIPKADDPTMVNLIDVVEQYFESTLVLLDTTDELILQRLNSPDPSKEGNNYKIPIPHQLMHALQNLEQALTEKESATDKIHNILTLVWMAKWVKEEDNTIPCPTE